MPQMNKSLALCSVVILATLATGLAQFSMAVPVQKTSRSLSKPLNLQETTDWLVNTLHSTSDLNVDNAYPMNNSKTGARVPNDQYSLKATISSYEFAEENTCLMKLRYSTEATERYASQGNSYNTSVSEDKNLIFNLAQANYGQSKDRVVITFPQKIAYPTEVISYQCSDDAGNACSHRPNPTGQKGKSYAGSLSFQTAMDKSSALIKAFEHAKSLCQARGK